MRLKILSFLVVLLLSGVTWANGVVKLRITQIVAHPALNAVRAGALDSLKDQGFIDGETLEVSFENAHGNITTAAQIAQKFAGENPHAVLAISTPSAQTILSAVGKKIPVVFAAITDPVAAKLVKSLEKPGENVTGITDKPPFRRQFEFIQELLPKVQKIGVIYNPGEANAVAALEEIHRVAKDLGLEILESVAIRSSEVGMAARRLVGTVDAIFIPPDNTVVSGLDPVIQLGHQHHLPIFAADIMLVKRGTAPMVGFDYYETGRQAGQMLGRILKGESPEEISVESPEKLTLKINLEAAEKMGILMSEKLLKEN